MNPCLNFSCFQSIVEPNKKEAILEEIKNVEKKIVYVNKDVVEKTKELLNRLIILKEEMNANSVIINPNYITNKD